MPELRQRRSSCPRSTPFRQHLATAWMPELRQRRSGCPMCCRKARPRLTNLPGRMPGKRQMGVASLWATFLWPHRERWLGRRRRTKAVASIARIEVREASDINARWEDERMGLSRKTYPLPNPLPEEREPRKRPPSEWQPSLSQSGATRLTPATPDSSAAQTPPDPATAPRP